MLMASIVSAARPGCVKCDNGAELFTDCWQRDSDMTSRAVWSWRALSSVMSSRVAEPASRSSSGGVAAAVAGDVITGGNGLYFVSLFFFFGNGGFPLSRFFQ